MRADFRVSLSLPDYQLPGVPVEELPDRLVEIARNAEASGYDAMFVCDHFHHSGEPGFEGHWQLEGLTVLSALAVSTERIQLGLMTGGVSYRNPSLLGKTVTTIDVLSKGRAIHGIGAGWLEHEYRAYGFEFESTKVRFEKLEDCLRITRAMFTEDQATVEGTHFSIAEACNRPMPVRGDIPIVVGGNGEKKTLRFVAKYADACNIFADATEAKRLMGVLDRHCEDVGRDPGEIWRTVYDVVVVGETHADAQKTFRQLRSDVLGDGDHADAIVGDPDEIAEVVAAKREAGIDGIVLHLYQATDPEALALAARGVAAGLGA